MMAEHESYNEEELNEARRYPVVVQWSDADQLYLASAPDLENLVVHGVTPEEAIAKIPEAVANWIYGMRSVGQSIPAPSPALAIH
ncbi:MAG: type II toxin-antitoxin system HicB family antitoxin [Thermomicrobiales bacterium]